MFRLPQNYKDKIINMKKRTLKMRNGELKTTKTRPSKIKKKRTSKMKAKRKSKIKKKKRMSKMKKRTSKMCWDLCGPCGQFKSLSENSGF